MVAKNHRQWLANPPLASDEWVDSRIYSDRGHLRGRARAHLQKDVDTGLPRVRIAQALRFPHDQHRLASPSSCAVDPIMRYARFSNVCPHRGMIIERRPSGSFLEGQASGNPKRMTCMFHAWQYDMRGNCVYISREKEGFQERLRKEDVGLRRLRCEVKFGGFVWVNLDDNPQVSLEDWAAGAIRLPAQDPRGGAARGLSLSQGHHQHELQTMARHQL